GTDVEPAVRFRLSHQTPRELPVDIGRIFLGASLQCAECHDHPEQDISRRDFYGMQAFFSRTRAGAEKFDTVPDKMLETMSPLMQQRLMHREMKGNDKMFRRPIIK